MNGKSSSSPSRAGAQPSSKAAEVQAQVDDVVNVMQQNIQKVVERGEKLETLQTKTDDLAMGAMQFKKGASGVRRQV
ncbi:hypothetical protein HDU93_007777 [Gonapodya sp. JEL0774]|nr:hypothetical protein HDU93_007777 [Gonapodya sp. JEL0774]